MGDLSKHMRSAIPTRDFAGPDRSFPVENKAHARAAELDAPKAEKKGTITAEERKHIDEKAKKELDKK